MPGPFYGSSFSKLVCGHWLDSIGNSIIVSQCPEEHQLTAVLTPLIDHPQARDRVLIIRQDKSSRQWRCGSAILELADDQQQRLVWVTDDGRRSVWSRRATRENCPGESSDASSSAFPWLLNNALPEPWLPLDVPRDILYDGARIAALLDIRQMIGPRSEPQERLTHILMDHDLHPQRGDYLVPGAESPLWQTLPVSETLRRSIAQRIHRIPHEALSQRVSWSGATEVWVGHHKISCRARDIETLESRWVLPPKDERKPLEIARLLALYSVFDIPLSNRRNGVHLGLDPQLRRQCDYELFASPLNAAVGNGHFSSKWPHVEWRFGSIGAYPSVLSFLPVNSVVCVNPPFTEAYLSDVMARLAELKLRFRLRIAVPIQDASWRKKLLSSLPSAQLLTTYYDASSDITTDLLHPTLLWEDPRCPVGVPVEAMGNVGPVAPTINMPTPHAALAAAADAARNREAAVTARTRARMAEAGPAQAAGASAGGQLRSNSGVAHSPYSQPPPPELSGSDDADERRGRAGTRTSSHEEEAEYFQRQRTDTGDSAGDGEPDEGEGEEGDDGKPPLKEEEWPSLSSLAKGPSKLKTKAKR